MADEPLMPQPNKITSLLKASIHCEGCKRKVKKILTQIQGVDFVDVDTKQQKVTVIGTVDADTLKKKLLKSGKQAQLWPITEKPEITDSDQRKKPKSKSDEEVSSKNIHSIPEQVKPSDTGDTAVAVNDAPEKTTPRSDAIPKQAPKILGSPLTIPDTTKETKSEDRKGDEGCSASGDAAEAASPKSEHGVGKSGTSGKKKKKKGQSGNNAAVKGSENQIRSSPPPPPQEAVTNQGPPRHHDIPRHPQYPYFNNPPPEYAVSYNTAYPSSAYTASYYAAPQPYSYSYGYMHPRQGIEAPPSDLEMNPRQPLDSFEIFSDENPNGCGVM